MKKEVDKSLIQLFMWIIAYEISKDKSKFKADDNDKILIDVLHKMGKLLSDSYDISIYNDEPLSELRISLAKSIIHFYYDHFKEVSTDDDSNGDGTEMLINFPISNGKFEREYQLVEWIGSGTFGKVCCAANVVDGQKYAIKRVQLYGEMREKVLKEVIIAAKMRSPYIIQYNSPWTENINNNNADNTSKGGLRNSKSERTSFSKSVIDEGPASGHILYIPMELCGIQIGGEVILSLKDAIVKINNELDQKVGDLITNMGAFIASQFIEEIVSGVNYLHSLKPPIIHRDLKPSNVFLTDGNGGNYLKLGDLGSATYHDNTNDFVASTSIELEHTCNKGTYLYMAPEVRNSSLYTEKCDAFSLGCIIMDLFCIEKPESDSELKKVFEACQKYFMHYHTRKFKHRALRNRILMYTRLIKKLTQPDPKDRTSIKDMIRFKEYRRIHSDYIVNILQNVNNFRKADIDRLSDYIVMNSLKRELQDPQLTEIEFQRWSDPAKKAVAVRLSWYGKDQYMDIQKAISEDKIEFKTNISNDDLEKIMLVIKEGFTIYAKNKPISNFIEKNIKNRLNLNSNGRCIIAFLENTYEQRNWIPFNSKMKYLYAFHTFTQHKRDLLIMIHYHPGIYSSPSSQILNKFDNHHVSSTLQQIGLEIMKLKKLHPSDEHLLLNNDDDVQLKQIRSLIGNQSAFCYISNKEKSFLIYYANCPFNIDCVYAEKVGLFHFAIFTLVTKATNDAHPSPLCIESIPLRKKMGKQHYYYKIIQLEISELTQGDHH